jgi:cytochrome c553
MRLTICCVLMSLPLLTFAISDYQQEYEAANHAAANWVHGEALYNDTCITCHGTDGGGRQDGDVPAIAAQHPRVIIRQLVDYRHDRRWDLRMEHFTDRHRLVDAQDVADVAAFIGALPPTRTTNVGDGEYADHGHALYDRLCASCHGVSGGGSNAEGIPRLAGQHYQYLMRQLHDALEGRRPNFPAEHKTLLQPLERADLVGLADYLSRLDARIVPLEPPTVRR